MVRRTIPIAHSVLGMIAALSVSFGVSRALAVTPATSKVDPGEVHVAVYEAVLQSWLGTDYSPALIAEQLSSAPKANDRDLSDCLKGLDFQPPASGGPVLSSLRGMRFARKGVRLIDRADWHAADGPLVTHVNQGQTKSLDSDLDRAMAHSLISFSRIQFDRSGDWALLSFSSVCGALCGSGSTLLMHKSHNTWKVFRRCDQWIS
jgi:hypothetical protein